MEEELLNAYFQSNLLRVKILSSVFSKEWEYEKRINYLQIYLLCFNTIVNVNLRIILAYATHHPL